MRIVFNLFNVGLGNNGGSRTLIMCAETLSKLGHEVIMFSNVKSGYTWHKPIGIKILHAKRAPSADIAIATGFKSVDNTVAQKAKRKAYYIRGYELWQAKEPALINSFKKLPCIVNSEWLKDHLGKNGVNSEIVYPGLDFNYYSNKNLEREDILGGLFHKKHKTKRHSDVIDVAQILKLDHRLINRDIKNASPKDMSKFYNSCKVWLSPSESEGLHNCPMESSLCGCGLVATDHKRSGTSDYAIHNQTALIYRSGDMKQCSEMVDMLMNDDKKRLELNSNMVELLRNKIGSRENNMKKFIDVIGGKR